MIGEPVAGWTVPYQVDDAFKVVRGIPGASDSADNGVIDVCFIGRLDQFQKRAHWLPAIIEGCQLAGRNFRWHIYGQGPLQAGIKADLQRRNLADKVCFHGWVDATTLAARLPLHDLFFLCSRWEGLPVAMVEAMLCGLACVVPEHPDGITYALREGGGWLYDARSPRACAIALIAATSSQAALIQKRREAQTIARTRLTGRVAEEQLAAFAAALPTLKSNGHRLEINHARRLRSVHAMVALKSRFLRLLREGRTNHQL